MSWEDSPPVIGDKSEIIHRAYDSEPDNYRSNGERAPMRPRTKSMDGLLDAVGWPEKYEKDGDAARTQGETALGPPPDAASAKRSDSHGSGSTIATAADGADLAQAFNTNGQHYSIPPSAAQNPNLEPDRALKMPVTHQARAQHPLQPPVHADQVQYHSVQHLPSASTQHPPSAAESQQAQFYQQQDKPPIRHVPSLNQPLPAQPLRSQHHAAIPTHQGKPDNNFESILNNPQTKDDIVETSPGERYLRFSEKLGSGAYKDVYRAYDTIEGIEVAWNAVNLSGLPKAERQYIVNEVRLLEKLNHSNIISFHGSWVNRELEQVIFVTEILSSGTLKSFINKVQVIRWKIAKRWAIQILKGLEYLHCQNPPIIHRDLKCDNIFINGTSGDLRIGDLGLSTVMCNKGKRSVLGTPEFMAPELYDEAYDQTIDIYAFGMCMLEIFTKELPYKECTNPAQIYKKVTHGTEPESLNRLRNTNAKDFIRLCLGSSDGSGGFTRPTATELLTHSFLAKKLDDDSEVEVDPRIIERPIPEAIPLSNGDGWRNSNEAPNTDIEINSRRGENAFYSEDDSIKQTSTRENLTNQTSAYQEIPFFKSDNSNFPQHADSERSHISSELNNGVRDNESSHQKSLEDQSHNHQYRSVPGDQDVNVISTQIGNPTGDEVNMSSNACGERHSDRDIMQDDRSGLENLDGFVAMPNSDTNIQRVSGLISEGRETENNEEITDEFVGMPNSETNIGKVTVLMGRGQEIEEEEDLRMSASCSAQQVLPVSDDTDHTNNGTWQGELSIVGGISPGSQQYLTTNDVVDESNLDPPFAQDKMTVVMTQSVEPYHVQFEFHLIEDDPCQVAREMVEELNMTEGAVLKLSEKLSALARSARMKQQSSTLYQQKRHDSVVQPSVAPDVKSKQTVLNNLDDNPMDNGDGTVLARSARIKQQSSSLYQHQQKRYDNVVQPSVAPDVKLNQTVLNNLDDKSMDNGDGTVLARSAKRKQQSSTLYQQKRHDNIVQPSVAPDVKSNQIVLNNLDDTVMDNVDGTVAVQTPLQLSAPLNDIGDREYDHGNRDSQAAGGTIFANDDDDESCSSEYMELKKEYEVKIKRAKKAYDTRMENLHRSREEKEAQHQKTLERHEKETAALEKRLKQAEQEQNRRLLQIQEEWEQKFAHAKKAKSKSPQNSELPPLPPSVEDKDSKSTVTGFEKNRMFAINLASLNDKISANGKSASIASTTPSLDGSCSDKSR